MIDTRRRGRLTWIFPGLIVMSAIGCRDTEPTHPLYRDLGTEGTPLLSGQSPRYAISDPKAGTADWHPFRDPAEAPEEAGDQDSPQEAEGDELEVELRELIADYNGIAADKDLEELLNYHIEKQQEELTPIIEVGFALAEKLPRLATALDEKLPDHADRIAAALAILGWTRDGNLVSALPVESLTIVSDTEVTAQLSGGIFAGGSTCRFLLIADEWFIEVPDAVDYASVKTALDAALAGFDGWLTALSSDEVPAEDVLGQVETMGKTLRR